jgi:hypothetical protein
MQFRPRALTDTTAAFEQRAIERGCDTFYLITFNFQARPF